MWAPAPMLSLAGSPLGERPRRLPKRPQRAALAAADVVGCGQSDQAACQSPFNRRPVSGLSGRGTWVIVVKSLAVSLAVFTSPPPQTVACWSRSPQCYWPR